MGVGVLVYKKVQQVFLNDSTVAVLCSAYLVTRRVA